MKREEDELYNIISVYPVSIWPNTKSFPLFSSLLQFSSIMQYYEIRNLYIHYLNSILTIQEVLPNFSTILTIRHIGIKCLKWHYYIVKCIKIIIYRVIIKNISNFNIIILFSKLLFHCCFFGIYMIIIYMTIP